MRNHQSRIEKLEGNMLSKGLDYKIDRELTEWFKAHPSYSPVCQKENNVERIPEHLSNAFQVRLECFSHNYQITSLSKFLSIWENVYP